MNTHWQLRYLTVAITGYNVILTQSDNFSQVDHHWWYKFISPPKPGSQCSHQNFTVGDTLITSNSFFDWRVISPSASDALAPYVSYNGTSMDTCDVFSLAIEANLQTMMINLHANVGCHGGGLPGVIRTTWSPWGSDTGYIIDKIRNDFFLGKSGAYDYNTTSVYKMNQM
jgi:hypothetical protein